MAWEMRTRTSFDSLRRPCGQKINITYDHMKKVQLVTSLEDRTLTWCIKYCTDNPMASLAYTQTTLNKDSNRPKSETQSVVGFKEIAMKIGETPWELDQRLKCGIREASMNLIDSQHRDWFIAALLPHLSIALSHQKKECK